MNSILIATIAGIIVAFCWGTSDYLSARGTKQLNPFQINLGLQLTSVIIVFGIYLISGLHLNNAGELIRIITSSLLLNIAFVIFVQALSGGAVGVIVPLGNAYPFFTVIFSVLFFHLKFSVLQLSAIIIVVVGAAMLAYEHNHSHVPLRQLHNKSLLALLAAFIWGIGFTIISPVTQTLSWQSITIWNEIVSSIFTVGLFLATSRRHIIADFKQIITTKIALVTGIFGEAGLVALYVGSAHGGSIVIPALLSACGPLITSLWASMFDHEKLGTIKRVGAFITVAGVIILNIN